MIDIHVSNLKLSHVNYGYFLIQGIQNFIFSPCTTNSFVVHGNISVKKHKIKNRE